MQADKTNILFVDDDVSLLAGLRRLLHKFRKDWAMQFCSSAVHALEHLKQGPIDVVVSDVRMPEIDGTKLLQTVALNHPGVIRFVLSGQAEKKTILKLVNVAHQHFTKPFCPNGLFATVSVIMEKRQQISCAELARQLTGLASVPISGQAYEALKFELKQDNSDMNQIIDIVRGDIGLGMKVCQLISTSFFGAPQPGCDVAQACRALGSDLLGSALEGVTESELGQRQGLPAQVDINGKLYKCLAGFWQVMQQPQSLATKTDNDTAAVFDYLTSLWGIHSDSISQPMGVKSHNDTTRASFLQAYSNRESNDPFRPIC